MHSKWRIVVRLTDLNINQCRAALYTF